MRLETQRLQTGRDLWDALLGTFLCLAAFVCGVRTLEAQAPIVHEGWVNVDTSALSGTFVRTVESSRGIEATFIAVSGNAVLLDMRVIETAPVCTSTVRTASGAEGSGTTTARVFLERRFRTTATEGLGVAEEHSVTIRQVGSTDLPFDELRALLPTLSNGSSSDPASTFAAAWAPSSRWERFSVTRFSDTGALETWVADGGTGKEADPHSRVAVTLAKGSKVLPFQPSFESNAFEPWDAEIPRGVARAYQSRFSNLPLSCEWRHGTPSLQGLRSKAADLSFALKFERGDWRFEPGAPIEPMSDHTKRSLAWVLGKDVARQ